MSEMSTDQITVRRDPACGPVDGLVAGQVARFLGLPFAEAPIGALRFAAPKPRARWPDVRSAFAFGPTAAQPDRNSTLIPEPEEAGDDILNLNVFAPAILPDRPLPVLVYIHGGGYFSGCNRSPWYDGAPFVEKGVIVVTPGYRLGVEGFMPVDGAPDNRGLLDWVAALEWVRDNIGAVGGDPARVTIAGQSAGAGAVATLLAAPAAKGLFDRAILFSGSIGFGGSLDRARAFAKRFSDAVGLPASAEALAKLSRRDLIAGYEAAARPEPGNAALAAARGAADGLDLQPLAGTASLPVTPSAAIAGGASAHVPLLVTTTQNEFVFTTEYLGDEVSQADLSAALERLGLDSGQRTRHIARYRDFAPASLLGQAITDRLFRAPMMKLAEIRKTSASAPTWTADYRWQSPASGLTRLRAAHCLDLPFYLDKLELESAHTVLGPHPPAALGASMHDAVVRFVRGEGPGWSPWTESGHTRVWQEPDAGVTNDMNVLADIWRNALP